MRRVVWLSILTLAACQKGGCEDESPRGQPEPADGGAPNLAADANLRRMIPRNQELQSRQTPLTVVIKLTRACFHLTPPLTSLV